MPSYGRLGQSAGFSELDILSSAAVLVGNPAQKLMNGASPQPSIVAQQY